ncbi:MAG TPA: DUF4157 domain-containing protein [Rhodanobacteraceae bacterium]|nr:DUF4157 domain-containing protein [Rhodanobacteraceae bacterium]
MWWRYPSSKQRHDDHAEETPAPERPRRAGPGHDRAAERPGEALPEGVREFLEAEFETDLGDVRVHADQDAHRQSADLGASAFTAGREIYFAKGMYAPSSREGRALLAHEVAHVIQQRRAGAAGAAEPLESDRHEAEREAEASAHAVEAGERIPTVSAAARGVHLDVGWAQRGPLPDPHGTLLLLNGFAKKFLDAAKMIYRNPSAMKLVDAAEAAGIQFGGFSEDGPAPAVGRAYTSGSSVYVPRTRTDAVAAMSDFLFELNNALRAPKFAALAAEAAKGSRGSVSARTYARRVVEQEVEGMLRLGQIWFETKKAEGRSRRADPHDSDFFLSDYESVHSGAKTQAQLVDDVLARVYDTGTLRGKTVEQHYMEEYPGAGR